MFPDDCSYPMIPLEPIGEIKTLINVGLTYFTGHLNENYYTII